MWKTRHDEILNGRGMRVSIAKGRDPLRFDQVIELWREEKLFRDFFTEHLANVPYQCFRWETPPITVRTINREFECVVLDSPGLEREVDINAFANQFRIAGAQHVVLTFPNLRGDALMVVPAPRGQVAAYGHLGAFLRLAPEDQRDQLWQAIANAIEIRLSSTPLWLSTAGMGVAWLHVRLDSRPKYYAHQPYRAIG